MSLLNNLDKFEKIQIETLTNTLYYYKPNKILK